MTRFIADRAKEAQASYVLIGASALIIRGIIERETKDLDFNIAPRKSADLQDIIRPYCEATKQEAVLVDGRTPEEKAAQTSFRVYKQVADQRGLSSNMKVDVSKNRCALVPSAYTEIDGVYVATVPLMVAFKICAIARQNRSMSSDILVKDALDLMSAVKHLKDHNETIPQDIVQLLGL